jgi:hypothetical protein
MQFFTRNLNMCLVLKSEWEKGDLHHNFDKNSIIFFKKNKKCSFCILIVSFRKPTFKKTGYYQNDQRRILYKPWEFQRIWTWSPDRLAISGGMTLNRKKYIMSLTWLDDALPPLIQPISRWYTHKFVSFHLCSFKATALILLNETMRFIAVLLSTQYKHLQTKTDGWNAQLLPFHILKEVRQKYLIQKWCISYVKINLRWKNFIVKWVKITVHTSKQPSFCFID